MEVSHVVFPTVTCTRTAPQPRLLPCKFSLKNLISSDLSCGKVTKCQLCLLYTSWDEKLLNIQIRDFGKGLSKAVKQQLGTPFFSSKNEEGMGLGVFLTQTTLARYDGKLTLTNHPEGGVLSVVYLPLAKLKVSK